MIQKTYREYIADTLMHMGESIANTFGGSFMTVRFADLFSEESEDERTGDEIALEIIERAGLRVKE